MNVSCQTLLQARPLPCLQFLYCTRTILRRQPQYEVSPSRKAISTRFPREIPAHGPSQHEVDHGGLDSKTKRVSLFAEKAREHASKEAQQRKILRSGGRSTSTITLKEREVFKGLFEEVFSRKKPEELEAHAVKEAETKSPTDYRDIFALFSDARMEHEGAPAKKLAKDSKPPVKQNTVMWATQPARPILSDQDREHIKRYPERLRGLASRATILSKADPSPDMDHRQSITTDQSRTHNLEDLHNDFPPTDHKTSEASTAEQQAIDSISMTQMKRISELLIQAAKSTDKDLWTACERHVFPLLAFLREEDPSNTTTTPSNSHPGEEPPFPLPPSIPPLPILTILYPALMLLTLRLLTTHYPLSPYPSTLLRHLRSLGLRSYVLGTSTTLYNTLLSHRWEVYSDLRGMVSLLEEMEKGGIEFDAETVQVLERVRAEQVEDEVWAGDEEKRRQEKEEKEASLKGKKKKKKKKTKEGQRRQKEEEKEEREEEEEWRGLSQGRRVAAWWAGAVQRGWLERLVGASGWRGRVMEEVRKKSGEEGGGVAAVVEREYADSVRGGGGEDGMMDGHQQQERWEREEAGQKVWL